MNKKIVHDALILMAFTLVLGLVLAVVYKITEAPIAQREYEKQQQAFKAVFEDAASFETVEYNKEKANEIVANAGYSDSIDDIQKALNGSGELLGYVVSVTATDASQGAISFSVGIRNDGTVNGYSITSIAETPGLGMKAVEESFYSQFQNKNVEEFVVVKQTPTSDAEIETITGSTITSKAMANGCNAALFYFRNELGGAQ